MNLIAFYSRADENYFDGDMKYVEVGNTERAAELVAKFVDADTFKIEQRVPYAADYDTCTEQAQKDLREGARPELVKMLDNLDAYDEIYLGYPNFWSTMPMAVYTFLEAYDWTGKTIHPFCTHGGSGLSNTEADIRRAARGATVTTGLAIKGSAVEGAETMIRSWVNSK